MPGSFAAWDVPPVYWYEDEARAGARCGGCARRAAFAWQFRGAGAEPQAEAICRACVYRPHGLIRVQTLLGAP